MLIGRADNDVIFKPPFNLANVGATGCQLYRVIQPGDFAGVRKFKFDNEKRPGVQVRV